MDGSFAERIASAQRAVAADPELPALRWALIELLMAAERRDDAATEMRTASDASVPGFAHALVRHFPERLSDAEAEVALAAFDPSHDNAIDLVRLAARTGRVDESLEMLQRAITEGYTMREPNEVDLGGAAIYVFERFARAERAAAARATEMVDEWLGSADDATEIFSVPGNALVWGLAIDLELLPADFPAHIHTAIAAALARGPKLLAADLEAIRITDPEASQRASLQIIEHTQYLCQSLAPDILGEGRGESMARKDPISTIQVGVIVAITITIVVGLAYLVFGQ